MVGPIRLTKPQRKPWQASGVTESSHSYGPARIVARITLDRLISDRRPVEDRCPGTDFDAVTI